MKTAAKDRAPGAAIVKICGLSRAGDVAHCVEAGADWLGFIFHPRSPRRVSPELAAGFDSGRCLRVGVFVDQSPDEISAIMEKARLDLAQLHGGQDGEFIDRVGAGRVIAVHWPERYAGPEELARRLAETDRSAYHLFDAGTGGGGHGRAFELDLIRRLAQPRPWLLAGGLTAETAAALDLKGLRNLIGFDFNSGLEDRPGHKNKEKIIAAVRAVRQAEAGALINAPTGAMRRRRDDDF